MDPTVLSLCSGIGGLDIGVNIATGGRSRVLGYVERDAYAASVILARMEDEGMEPAPIWCGDIADMPTAHLAGQVGCVTAGFPCQPWSNAGKRRGTEDERWIWDDIVRLLRDVGPRFVYLENVRGLVSGRGLEPVLGALASLGFDAEWCVLRASDVGAPHIRQRVFILAHSMRERQYEERKPREGGSDPQLGREDVANPHGDRCQWSSKPDKRTQGGIVPLGWRDLERRDPNVSDADSTELRTEQGRREPRWQGKAVAGVDGTERHVAFPPGPEDAEGWRQWPGAEPSIRRGPDGIPELLVDRADRLRCLGNAVVPQQAALAFTALLSRLGG